MEELAGKVAVITGGARGVGLGLARAFAEEGIHLVLADIDQAALRTTVDTLRAAGTEAIGVATWEQVIAGAVYSVLHGLNAFLPTMLKQGEGHIVNTASRQGLVPVPILGAYPPAKAAVIALSEMLHAELAEREAPVGVTVLTPGGVRTEGILASLAAYENAEHDDPAMHEFLASRVANAVEPLDLGRLVVRAIHARALYVNTHRETLTWLQERVDRMVADADLVGTVR